MVGIYCSDAVPNDPLMGPFGGPQRGKVRGHAESGGEYVFG